MSSHIQTSSTAERVLAGFILSLIAATSNAELQGRLQAEPGGTYYYAWYDTDLNITWLTDVGYLWATGNNGGLNWWQAKAWINSLNASHFMGQNGWRLPRALPLNGVAFLLESVTYDGSTDITWNIGAPGSPYPGSTASELAHLYYQTLGNQGYYDLNGQPTGCQPCLVNRGPFINFVAQSFVTDSDLGIPYLSDYYLTFDTYGGSQHLESKYIGGMPWLVHDGDPFNPLTNPDVDGDGWVDSADNCSLVSNPTQLDADNDGYGNICDADINNSGLTTTKDFSMFRDCLNESSEDGFFCGASDMDGSGLVTTTDFALLRGRLNTPPGPSGLHPQGP